MANKGTAMKCTTVSDGEIYWFLLASSAGREREAEQKSDRRLRSVEMQSIIDGTSIHQLYNWIASAAHVWCKMHRLGDCRFGPWKMDAVVGGHFAADVSTANNRRRPAYYPSNNPAIDIEHLSCRHSNRLFG